MSLRRLPRASFRTRAAHFVIRHQRPWELGTAVLAIFSVILGMAAVSGPNEEAYAPLEWGLTALFAAEYLFRAWAAPDRWQYVRHNLVELVAVIPPARGFRLLRLLRIFRVASDLADVLATLRLSHQARLISRIALLWLAVLFVSAVGLYWAEREVNPAVTSIADAIWWAVVTLTTVGYGDVTPITLEGRIAAGILMVLGITFFSILTAALTSALAARHAFGPSTTSNLSSRLRELEELRATKRISGAEYRRLRAKTLRGA